MDSKAFWKGTVLLGGSALASRVLGLIRDHLLATGFGATGGFGVFDLDIYYAAFRLPDLLYNLLIYGTISSAFVPIFAQYWKKGEKSKATEFTANVLSLALTSIFILSGMVFFLTPYIMPLLVPGFTHEKLSITISVTRIMLIAPVFFTISGVLQGVQNSLGKFFWYSLGPIVYNVGIIGGILFFSKSNGIYGIAFGVVAGSILHAISQFPALRMIPIHMKMAINWARSDMLEMFRLMIPRILGLSLSQFTLVVDTIIGSTLMAGSITVLNYATNINYVPLGVISVSAAIVSFGTLSSLATHEDKNKFLNVLKSSMERILMLIIPATVGILTLRFQIVRLILGRGKFGWEDTILTANTLGLLAIGLVGHSLIFLLARAFYSWKNTKTPLFIGFVAFLANIIVSIILTKFLGFGVYGLAVSNAVSALLNMIGLLVFLKKELHFSFYEIFNFSRLAKFAIASLIMGLFVQATKQLTGQLFFSIDTYLEITLQTLSSIVIGIIIYFLTLKWLDSVKEVK